MRLKFHTKYKNMNLSNNFFFQKKNPQQDANNTIHTETNR